MATSQKSLKYLRDDTRHGYLVCGPYSSCDLILLCGLIVDSIERFAQGETAG